MSSDGGEGVQTRIPYDSFMEINDTKEISMSKRAMDSLTAYKDP